MPKRLQSAAPPRRLQSYTKLAQPQPLPSPVAGHRDGGFKDRTASLSEAHQGNPSFGSWISTRSGEGWPARQPHRKYALCAAGQRVCLVPRPNEGEARHSHKRRVLGNHHQLQSADDNRSERPRHFGPELLRASTSSDKRRELQGIVVVQKTIVPRKGMSPAETANNPRPAGTAQGSTTEHSAAPGARGVIPSTTPSDLTLWRDAGLFEELQGSTLRKDQNTQRQLARLSSPRQYTLRFMDRMCENTRFSTWPVGVASRRNLHCRICEMGPPRCGPLRRMVAARPASSTKLNFSWCAGCGTE